MWQFLNCIDTIDDKNNEHQEEQQVTIFLLSTKMAVVGPEYKFVCVDIGVYGENSDGGISEQSVVGRRFDLEC